MHTYRTSQNAALLVLRVIVAIIFLHAGIAKWFLWSIEPMEGLPVWLHYMMLFLSIAEPIGAVAVAVGFLTRAASACLAIIMMGSIPVSHFMMGVPFFTAPQLPGWDANLMILGGCLALAAFGAGAWSMDALRRTQIPRPAAAPGTPGSATHGSTSARRVARDGALAITLSDVQPRAHSRHPPEAAW